MNQARETSKDIQAKIEEWLTKEGYPVEFATAEAFAQHGFTVLQGRFFRDPKEGKVRELDVVASTAKQFEDTSIGISHIIECKWSRDKPWIVFTSAHTTLSPSTCIEHTIGSLLGVAAIWCEAGKRDLHGTDTFSAPARGGFGGRQAFSSGNDTFYAAMQSVISAAAQLTAEHDEYGRLPGNLPATAVIGLPVIVVDGLIFECSFDADQSNLNLREAERVRVHWGGSENRSSVATVDIVSLDHLGHFVEKRAEEMPLIVQALSEGITLVKKVLKSGKIESLKARRDTEGSDDLPPLLQEIQSLLTARIYSGGSEDN